MKDLRGRKRTVCAVLSGIALLLTMRLPVQAAGHEGLSAGTYYVDAKFYAYVNAMGGQQFGRPLLRDEGEHDAPDSAQALADAASYDSDKAKIVVDASGNAEMTLYFKRSAVVIYGVEAFTFIDPVPAYDANREPPQDVNSRGVKDGTIGIYDASGRTGDGGSLITAGVKYTTASATALDPLGNQVHYVNSITFPLPYAGDTYYLALYINSQVMGVEFCNKNAAATATTYQSWVELDWNSVSKDSTGTSGGNDSGKTDPAPAPESKSVTSTVNMNSSGITGTGTGSTVDTAPAPVSATNTAQAQNVTGEENGGVLGEYRGSAAPSGNGANESGGVLGANRDTVTTGDETSTLAVLFFAVSFLMLLTTIHLSGWQRQE